MHTSPLVERFWAAVIESTGSTRQQGEWWSRRADDWTTIQEPTAVPLYHAALDRLTAHAHGRLLDVGCGAGLFCLMAAGRGMTVTGVDAASSLVSIASDRVPDGRFDVGEMETLPYGDQSFDIVTAFNVLQYAADPAQVLAEAARVTRDGGTVMIATWGRQEDCEARSCLAAVRSLLPPSGAPGPFALSEARAVRALATRAGLDPLDVIDLDAPFEYDSLKVALRGLSSEGPAVRASDFAGESTVRAALADALSPCRTPSGGYRLAHHFRILTARKG